MNADIASRLGALFAEQPLGVLSTHGDRPHASLVAVAAAADLRRIFFATPRTTLKYANLKHNPVAALLVHDAGGRPDDLQRAVAVTVGGRVVEVAPGDAEAFDTVYLGRHPLLSDFVSAPTTARMAIDVADYRLVRHFQDVTIYRVT